MSLPTIYHTKSYEGESVFASEETARWAHNYLQIDSDDSSDASCTILPPLYLPTCFPIEKKRRHLSFPFFRKVHWTGWSRWYRERWPVPPWVHVCAYRSPAASCSSTAGNVRVPAVRPQQLTAKSCIPLKKRLPIQSRKPNKSESRHSGLRLTVFY